MAYVFQHLFPFIKGTEADLAAAVLRYKGVVLDSIVEDRQLAEATQASEDQKLVEQLNLERSQLGQLLLQPAQKLSPQTNQRIRALRELKPSTAKEVVLFANPDFGLASTMLAKADNGSSDPAPESIGRGERRDIEDWSFESLNGTQKERDVSTIESGSQQDLPPNIKVHGPREAERGRRSRPRNDRSGTQRGHAPSRSRLRP